MEVPLSKVFFVNPVYSSSLEYRRLVLKQDMPINMHSFLSDCRKHEKARSHLEAYNNREDVDVAERVDVLFSCARREEVERQNEEVQQNRGMLKILMKAVLLLGKQELSIRGQNKKKNKKQSYAKK